MDEEDMKVFGYSVLVLATLFLFIVFLESTVRISSTGDGKHTGFITAIQQEGYIFQNYNVYVKTDNSSSQEDVYCLNRANTDLANKLKDFSARRKLVSISFHGVRGFGFGLCWGQEITDVQLDVQK